MIKLFFEYLATRRYKENDLSDITWALCHACPDFKRIFIHFFFPDLEIDLIEYFERETRDDDEGNSYWFELSEEKHEEFEAVSLQEQRELLKSFMDEVIRYPLNILK